jgi:hypothetical protein
MIDQERKVQARLKWVQVYHQLKHASKTCRKCGISRLTLQLWRRRYAAEGVEGLKDRSRKPYRTPGRKIFLSQEQLILQIRKEKK